MEPGGREGDVAMERYARGDDAAFEAVYHAVAPRLLRHLGRKTRDPARAQDLLQDTMIRIHLARFSFTPGAEVLPWAFGIARYLFLDGIRADKRHERRDAQHREATHAPISGAGFAEQVVEAKELSARLERVLMGLPESQRIAFELVEIDGLSLAQAAQVLGTTANGVKVRVCRTKKKLDQVIGAGEEEDQK